MSLKSYLSASKEKKGILKSKLVLLGNLLGILQEDPYSWFESDKLDKNINEEEIEALIVERNEAKMNKDFEKADVIRAELMSKGIELMDSSSGTSWKLKT